MPPKLQGFIREASQFVVAFPEPISKSAPHIYISALPFLRTDSQIYQAFAPQFPSTLKCSTSVNRRIHPLLRFDTPDEVTCMAFSNDGMRIATASSSGTLQIWDTLTGEALSGLLTAQTGSITCASFSPSSVKGRIVIGGGDHTLRVMGVQTGKVVVDSWKAHSRPITVVAYASDGSHIVSGGADSKVRVWNAETGKAVGKALKGQSGDSLCIAFAPGSIHFACMVSSSDRGIIFVWDLSSGEIITGPLEGHTSNINFSVFSPDGQHLASASNKVVRVWDMAEKLVTDTGVVKRPGIQGPVP
ncbi:WD40-repeat-containing domain protein [Mycena vulgaris]|nr:WD40-repeat-containing domain protein [Mycena vulgaris]